MHSGRKKIIEVRLNACGIQTMDSSIHNKVRQDFNGEVCRALSAILWRSSQTPSGSRPRSQSLRGALVSTALRPTGNVLIWPSLFAAHSLVQHMRSVGRAKETVMEELPIFNPEHLLEGVTEDHKPLDTSLRTLPPQH